MIKNFTNYGTWWKTPFYISSAGVQLRRVMQKPLPRSLLLFTFDAWHFGWLSRDDTIYKSLADIERGFRVLKSEIDIGPLYHRLPNRIRAHAAICFMALILHRVMRMRLRAGDTQLSPERALHRLRRIQHHQGTVNDMQPVTGLSTISQEHTAILAALTIKKPSQNTQLTLL